VIGSDLLSSEGARRNVETHSAKIEPHVIEPVADMRRCVFEETDRGLDLFDDAGDVRPDPSLVVDSGSQAGD
jgi:hypothetical protein